LPTGVPDVPSVGQDNRDERGETHAATTRRGAWPDRGGARRAGGSRPRDRGRRGRREEEAAEGEDHRGRLEHRRALHDRGRGKIWDTGSDVDNWRDIRSEEHLQGALAAALHLREADLVQAGRGAAFIGYIFNNERGIASKARFVSLTDKQLEKARYQYRQTLKAVFRR